MRKIQAAGNGFIKIGDHLFNLKQFKSVKKTTFGRGESPEGYEYGIVATPLEPSEENIKNGVDGSHFIATYMGDEENHCDLDFEEVTKALNG